eukprot:6314-Heterococcus_DN1.PRE.2
MHVQRASICVHSSALCTTALPYAVRMSCTGHLSVLVRQLEVLRPQRTADHHFSVLASCALRGYPRDN